MVRESLHLKSGFTLIELSIVLVIIGLIVGGILVGRDLIQASSVRAQITQIEKFHQAVNTFKGKYGYLPGDIPDPDASRFGFIARGTFAGEGDGNGVVQGICNGAGCNGFYASTGEAAVFWVDLAKAQLIDNNFTTASSTLTTLNASGSGIDAYLPAAKYGNGNYLYVWNGGSACAYLNAGDGFNYYGLSAVTQLGSGAGWALASNPALSVSAAASIDQKIDDGFPQGGRVMAWYINYPVDNYCPAWAASGGVEGMNVAHYPGSTATPGSATTCYDNNNKLGAPPTYSLSQNNGSGINCALSFRFQ